MCHLAKYKNRPSPPYPAAKCHNASKIGNDGRKYKSVPDKNGRYAWKHIFHKFSRKSSQKSYRKPERKSVRKIERKSQRKYKKSSSKKSNEQDAIFVMYRINPNTKDGHWTYPKSMVLGDWNLPSRGYLTFLDIYRRIVFTGNSKYTSKMRGKLTEFFNKLKTKKIVEEYRIELHRHNYIAASFGITEQLPEDTDTPPCYIYATI